LLAFLILYFFNKQQKTEYKLKYPVSCCLYVCYYESRRECGSVGEVTCSPWNNGEHAAASAALDYRNYL